MSNVGCVCVRRTSAPKVKPYAHLVLPGVNPKEAVPGWQAPASPFGLLEEELWQSPWKLLLGCMLLNKTSGKQVGCDSVAALLLLVLGHIKVV